MNISWEAGTALAVAFSMLVVAIRLYVEKNGEHAPPASHSSAIKPFSD